MADNRITHSPDTRAVGKAIEDLNYQAIMRRRSWERRWYNTNWFDDGMHFRTMPRNQNVIIDHAQRSSGYVERAIPRASKQIRGIGALLLTPDYYPTIYPERISQTEFMQKLTGQVDQQAYQKAMQTAKDNARYQGIFIQKTWEDELELDLKLADMILLTMKNGISFLQIYTDEHSKRVAGEVLDAFDIIMFGDKRELSELPFMTKATPVDFNEVLSDPRFDEENKAMLTSDNLYATSEVKQAYMQARYGSKLNSDGINSIVQRETHMKEYLSDDNWEQAKELSAKTGAMEHKSKGDMIMRHTFSAGGVTLHDEYVDCDDYPYAELRMESGMLYQIPVMERFIPLNKSQDVVVTRIEKWINTMVAGIWTKRKGENFKLANIAGGMVAEYEGTPPEQAQIGSVGTTPFQFLQVLDKYVEEQGISSTNISQLPNNIANNTIENIQQQEYTNLRFATARLKKCVKRIGELIIERADKDYIKPIDVAYKEGKEAKYFSVIGSRGRAKHKEIGKELPDDIITLNRKLKIRIEADAGFGLTQDGRRQALEVLMKEMIELYKLGFVGPQAMSMLVKRFIEEYGYGSTEEFMEALEQGVTQGQLQDNQLNQMKLAVLQVLKDLKLTPQEIEGMLVNHNTANLQTTKLGVLQTMKEVGLLDQLGQEGKVNIEVDNLVKLYKDASPEIRREIEQKLGLQPASDEPISPSQADSAHKLHEVVKSQHEMKMNEQGAEQQQQQIDNQADQADQQNQLQQQAQEQQASQPANK